MTSAISFINVSLLHDAMKERAVVKRRSREAKRQRWAQIAIGVFLILLMVVSIAQVSLDQNSNNKIRYHDTTFRLTPQGFVAKVEGVTQQYDAAPFSEENGTIFFQGVHGGVTALKPAPGVGALLQQAQVLALTFDPRTPPELASFLDLVRLQLSQAFPNVVNGMLLNVSDYTLPVINCSMATSQGPVIQLLINSTGKDVANITLVKNCITIRATPAGMLAASSYLRLARAGVIHD